MEVVVTDMVSDDMLAMAAAELEEEGRTSLEEFDLRTQQDVCHASGLE